MSRITGIFETLRDSVRLSFATVCGLAVALTASPVAPLQAGGAVRTITVETIEYVDYEGDLPADSIEYTADGYVETVYYDDGFDGDGYYEPAALRTALATYGPFRVVARDRAELIGDTDSYTPGEFRRMLADFPAIRTLDIVECGGTVDDNANLQLARMIRTAGIATHVPANGSARSGGVELFLAGARRSADRGAEFIVHSWRNELGREASDYPITDAVHAPYLSFYREVGMAPERARAFYALTNSVPHAGQRQLSLGELAGFGLLN